LYATHWQGSRGPRVSEPPTVNQPRIGRILIVDDEAILREVYTGFLAAGGYLVESAGGGKEALDLLGRERFDLILTDIAMPDMDGLQLLRAVRERDLDIPVVLVTGNPNVQTAVEALEQGALRYLLKPVSEEALRQVAAEAIRLHKIATLKREALDHLGISERLVGDRAGLDATFARGLKGLWMAYQPIVRAADGSLFGHEALVRTTEPTLPHPGAFFDVAERLGRVHDLARRIRGEVARSLEVRGSKTAVFLNLHPQDLLDDALFSLDSPLSRQASSVVIEVTERAALPDVHDLRARVRSLRELGFRIAIDDLGAGYAGLTSFAILEPEVVKLDMSLIRGVNDEPIKRRLVSSMVDLCKELGILVVAEGIETEAERETLSSVGCDLLQGFLIGRPAPFEEAAS
jgi:EAL domain-containing protein (putative c-di-GMP-specific phosphodiesterase class I)